LLELRTVIQDLAAEGEELHSFLITLDKRDWQKVTLFKGWTVEDVVDHLYFGDCLAITSNRDTQEFLALMGKVRESNLSLVEFTRRWLSDEVGLNDETEPDNRTIPEILGRWRKQFIEMCATFEASDPDRRLAWAGPGMGIKMFATARLMETWAHSWAIYDVLGETKNQTDRIRHIATIGVKTYDWSFANRKLDPPGRPPHLILTSPSGEVWRWRETQRENSIIGDAVEFCQVVTQVRNIADTHLKVRGDAANRWMEIAQCFAGPPEDPPGSGMRYLSS
jgi:uncharacterized protein (TIGR03084 family)